MSAITVLIVEDDKSIRDLYADAFGAAGLTVLTAENGKDGVDLALTHHPDAILMDIMMPVMGGHEAVNLIKKTPWGKNAKIVYLTNMTDTENVVTAVSQGGLEYIIKANLTPKEVVNRVRMVMKK
jgi:DNA-binding response OmpR family regulator